MLATSWSIALLICSAATLFLILLAAATAVRILLFWDADADSERQIDLEGRVWLAAALVETGLAIQIFSLLLLVMAADAFSGMIAGAMCATGSFLANDYGSLSLLLKIAGIFLCGLWIVLHRLDLQAERYPLLPLKFWYILLLVPFLAADGYVLFRYLEGLEPDIITSCCGVLFADTALQTNFYLPPIPAGALALLFILVVLLLTGHGLYLIHRTRQGGSLSTLQFLSHGIGYLLFFLLALASLTVFFSSYIYAMPFHNCPFDVIKAEYGYRGYPLYFTLFGASFAGISCAVAAPLARRPGLAGPVAAYLRAAIRIAVVFLLLYTILVVSPYFSYMLAGGET